MKRGTPDHPKTLALMKALGLRKYEAVGLLESLWHFTARYAPRGDIGKWSPVEIAKALDWPGDPAELISALVENGWIDSDKTYHLLIHDWPQHCDQAVRKWLARNDLRFATRSGRRPDKVRLVSGPPLPLPEPTPEPTPTPPPACPDTIASRPGNGHPPEEDEVKVDPSCPRCGTAGSLIRERLTPTRRDPGWFCAPKRKGCGACLDLGHPKVVEQLDDKARRSVIAELAERYGGHDVEADTEQQRLDDEVSTFFDYDDRDTKELAESLFDFLRSHHHLSRQEAFDAWARENSIPRGVVVLVMKPLYYLERAREREQDRPPPGPSH